MKNIKYMSLMMAFACVFSLSLVSCGDDDMPAKPSITLTEVGHHNEKHAHPGYDMHLEAEVIAEGLINRIDVEIHQEHGGTYRIEKSYTDGRYIGVRNTEFHEHIDIPADAPLGEYHLHFTVTDMAGQSTTAESDVMFEEGGEEHDDD